jgi:hypothetical protein
VDLTGVSHTNKPNTDNTSLYVSVSGEKTFIRLLNNNMKVIRNSVLLHLMTVFVRPKHVLEWTIRK